MVSEIWFCSASLEFFHHGTGKGAGKHSVLLLRRREEVVHIPKVVTHTRTSHQHVEQTVEVPRPKKINSFLIRIFFGNKTCQLKLLVVFRIGRVWFFLYWVESLQIYFHRCRCLFLCNRKNRFTFQRSWPKRVPWMRMTCFWLRGVTIISHLSNFAQMTTPTMKVSVSYVDERILEMFWKNGFI